jgi:hypothetical protein
MGEKSGRKLERKRQFGKHKRRRKKNIKRGLTKYDLTWEDGCEFVWIRSETIGELLRTLR